MTRKNAARHIQKGISTGGIVINSDDLTKIRFRLLPWGDTEEEVNPPGKLYVFIWCPAIKKGTTSPESFGLQCPIIDSFKLMCEKSSKDEREKLRNLVQIRREYWLGGFDRNDPGSVEKPNIRILRAKRSVYQQILDYICTGPDEEGLEDLENIFDPVTGRDVIIWKEGSGVDTEWHTKFLDPASLSDNPQFMNAVSTTARTFRIEDHFPPTDYGILGKVYRILTGKDLDRIDTPPTQTRI